MCVIAIDEHLLGLLLLYMLHPHGGHARQRVAAERRCLWGELLGLVDWLTPNSHLAVEHDLIVTAAVGCGVSTA